MVTLLLSEVPLHAVHTEGADTGIAHVKLASITAAAPHARRYLVVLDRLVCILNGGQAGTTDRYGQHWMQQLGIVPCGACSA